VSNRKVQPKRPQSFAPGEMVRHRQLGVGQVVSRWGCISEIDDKGKVIVVNADGIYDVRFGAQTRPVNACQAPCRSIEVGSMKKKHAQFLGHKEVTAEAEKARKYNNQGAWIRGCWERQKDGSLKLIIPRFIPGPAA
jgi:hypothetical protein